MTVKLQRPIIFPKTIFLRQHTMHWIYDRIKYKGQIWEVLRDVREGVRERERERDIEKRDREQRGRERQRDGEKVWRRGGESVGIFGSVLMGTYKEEGEQKERDLEREKEGRGEKRKGRICTEAISI